MPRKEKYTKPISYIKALAMAIREVKAETQWKDIYDLFEKAKKKLRRKKKWKQYID